LNDPACKTDKTSAVAAEVKTPLPLPNDAIYVDPLKGSDGNAGTPSAPVQSIPAAISKSKQAGTVVLRGGAHYLEKSLELSAIHSGMTIKAYPGESPVVSGGKRLETTWEPFNVTAEGVFALFQNMNAVYASAPDNKSIRDLGKQADAVACEKACAADTSCTGFTWHDAKQGVYANVCYGRLDGLWNLRAESGHTSGLKKQAMNIYKANIKGQVPDVPGLQLDGARATRARFPNLPGGIETSPGYGAMISEDDASWTPPDFNKYGKVVYYTDTTDAHHRNNTPSNWFQEYMIGTNGLCSVYDPPVGYWCSEHPSGGGAFAFRTPSGVTPKSGALPNAPYKDVSEMIINVWRPARWANWMFGVGHYDAAQGNFTFGAGGNQGARGNDKGGDFFVENVFEELDNPGEFFFDKATGELYLFYNGTGAPPADMEVVVPQVKTLLNISGTQWAPVKDVTLDGLTFKSSRYTYMDPHGVPSAGDWALDRISAVFLQGTEGVHVQNSIFERLDGNAVMVSGYNRNATIQDNDFSYIGGNAVVAWGYTNETENSGYPYYSPNTNYPQAGVDGTDGNHPRYTSVLRNSAREIGLYEKQSSFFMEAKTAQSLISGNVFFNGPRAGINFNDGFGGGDEISHNLVFSSCRESGDHGPINSWDRQPFLTDVRTGEPSMILQWREIHHNFLIDNYSPQENVDNDDGSAFYHTHDNFLVYGGQGMKNDFGGHDNHHFNNVYAYVGQGMGVCGTLPGHEDYFYNNKVVMTQSGSTGGPQCSEPKTQMHDNQYFTPAGTVKECGMPLADAVKKGLDTGSTVASLPSDSTILGWARALLSMKTEVPEVFVV